VCCGECGVLWRVVCCGECGVLWSVVYNCKNLEESKTLELIILYTKAHTHTHTDTHISGFHVYVCVWRGGGGMPPDPLGS